MVQIRDYVPVADAAAVARLFIRAKYGPVSRLRADSAAELDDVFTERVARLFLVAASGDEIHGTLAFVQGCGRRVARSGELFCSLFVVDPSFRGTLVAGQLFKEAFDRLISMEVSSLRLEVSPTNDSALAVFERSGFQWTSQVRADEDGYCELVSYLPLIMRTLSTQLESHGKSTMMPQASIRALGAPRTASRATREARNSAEYVLETKDLKVDVEIDYGTGQVTRSRLEGVGTGELDMVNPFESGPDAVAAVGNFWLNSSMALTINSAGTLSLVSGKGRQILVDHLPVVRGVQPVGWRRPARFGPTIKVLTSEWILSWSSGGFDLERRVDLRSDGFSVMTRVSGGGIVMVSPWVTLRKAELYLEDSSGRMVGGAFVKGVWPADFTDFEALAPDLAPDFERAIWQSGEAAIEASWSGDATARLDGGSLPQLIGGAAGPITYEINVVEPVDAREAVPPAGLSFERRWSTPNRLEADVLIPDWQLNARGRDSSTSAVGRSAVTWSSRARGVISWQVDSSEILSSPFPVDRKLGPLRGWKSGLWISRAESWNPEQGIEWIESDDASPLSISSTQEGDESWDLSHLVHGDVAGLRLRVPFCPTSGISIANVVPRVQPETPVHLNLDGGSWTVNSTNLRWSAGANAAVVQLETGKFLRASPVEAGAGEVFVRTVRNRGIFLSLVSNDSESVEWDLEIHAHLGPASYERI